MLNAIKVLFYLGKNSNNTLIFLKPSVPKNPGRAIYNSASESVRQIDFHLNHPQEMKTDVVNIMFAIPWITY